MKRNEFIVLIAVLIGVNLPLLFGGFADQLVYDPQKVVTGQWWRLVTHPFVHVSLYHLLLDGTAFLLLFAQLAEKHILKRLGYLLGINAAVVLGVTFILPHLQVTSYCGLSGIAHGLMALWCLERMGGQNGKAERKIAIGVFAGLLAKCLYEVATGHAFFASMHFGDVGVPVVVSHFAGVIGAAVMYGLFTISNLKMTQKQLALNVLETIK